MRLKTINIQGKRVEGKGYKEECKRLAIGRGNANSVVDVSSLYAVTKDAN